MPTTKPTADFTYTDQELLDLWRECLAVISIKGKSYKMGSNGREFTAFDLGEVRGMVEYFERRVGSLSGIQSNKVRMKRN
jgi:hypothetical protein